MARIIGGLMLLLGAEINSEIEAAAVEKRLTGHTPSPETPAIAPAVSTSSIEPALPPESLQPRLHR